MAKWTQSAGCASRTHCTACLNGDGKGEWWRRSTALTFNMPDQGTCPWGQTWDTALSQKAVRDADLPRRMGERLAILYEPLLRRVQEEGSAELVVALSELIESGAMGSDRDKAVLVAEEVATRRGIDLDARVEVA